MLEASVARRFPERNLQFERLGKPFPTIFAEGARRIDSLNVLMVSDQLETDIRGARTFGIDSALISSGVARRVTGDVAPTYTVTRLVD